MRYVQTVVIVFLLAGWTQAAEPAAQPAALDPAIARFVTGDTLMIARCQPARIDPATVAAWLDRTVALEVSPDQADTLKAKFDGIIPTAQTWIAAFDHAGGKTVYMTFSLAGIQSGPDVFVVPLEAGADAKTIQSLMISGEATGPTTRPAAAGVNPADFDEAVVVEGAVLVGRVSTVEKLKSAKSADRPALAQALDAAGDAPIKLALQPTFATRLLAGHFLPDQLPPSLGGGPSYKIVDGLSWAALGLGRPDHELYLFVQCKDATGASAISAAITGGLSTWRDAPFPGRDKTAAAKAADALKPVQTDSSLAIHTDAKALNDVVIPQIAWVINAGRKASMRLRSMAQMRQLLLDLDVYTEKHNLAYPDKIEDIADSAGGADKLKLLLINPIDPKRSPGYTYVKPANAMGKQPGEKTILLYENSDDATDPVNVGFADLHIEQMTKGELDERLKAGP